ncbi:hypothetical protein ELY16_06720 [Legionella qingyii]|nr:hypothetical protein ELY16_06720 [Legionella qingyii]
MKIVQLGLILTIVFFGCNGFNQSVVMEKSDVELYKKFTITRKINSICILVTPFIATLYCKANNLSKLVLTIFRGIAFEIPPFFWMTAYHRPYKFSVLAHGEGWHNRHHAFPFPARHRPLKWQIDYLLQFYLSLFGLVNEVSLPTKEQIKKE